VPRLGQAKVRGGQRLADLVVQLGRARASFALLRSRELEQLCPERRDPLLDPGFDGVRQRRALGELLLGLAPQIGDVRERDNGAFDVVVSCAERPDAADVPALLAAAPPSTIRSAIETLLPPLADALNDFWIASSISSTFAS
jgi:hypothetical protein